MSERGALLPTLDRLFAGPRDSVLTIKAFLEGLESRSYAFAVAALNLPARPTDVLTLQALAAAGQPRLMEHYIRELSRHGLVAAQVLLVADAAKALIGSKVDDAALNKLAAACSAACRPIDDKRGTIEFRTKVAAVLAKRAAKIAYDDASIATPEKENETHKAAIAEFRKQMGQRQPKLGVEAGLMALDGSMMMFS